MRWIAIPAHGSFQFNTSDPRKRRKFSETEQRAYRFLRRLSEAVRWVSYGVPQRRNCDPLEEVL